jgi:hypothetical protein
MSINIQQFPAFRVENHGSIFLLRPQTDAARSWIEEHIGSDNGYQPYWPTVVIEARYIVPIIEAINTAGMEVDE